MEEVKLEWKTIKVMVNELINLEINPRKISEEKRKKLIESLEKFNLVEIPVINTDYRILSGNQRITALAMIGRGEEEIDVRFPNRTLTEKELKEYTIIANTHAGEFDFDLIESEFADLDFEEIGVDIDKIEFETSRMFETSFKKFHDKKEQQIPEFSENEDEKQIKNFDIEKCPKCGFEWEKLR